MRALVKTIPAFCAAFLFVAVPCVALAEQGLQHCADSFPDSSVQKAPQRKAPAADEQTVFLCERSGSTTFFALEYDPDKFAPLWVANQIKDTFGPNGCATKTREQIGCYFNQKDVEACVRREAGSDPFHTDTTLTELDIDRLTPDDFSGTGHDRGHMAPGSTFSWHVCGAYKTYTMANMAAQWGSLNRQLWAQLEAQVVFWGVKDGPIHVVTGPIWTTFPSNKFKAIRDGTVKKATIPKAGTLLTKTNGKKLADDIPRPTGFYKVIYRPARNGQPARAIAFLVPHTKQTGLPFWHFVSTVELVEDASGLRFGFDDRLKSVWPEVSFWQDASRRAPKGWSPGEGCQDRMPVIGWMEDKSPKERTALCVAE